MWGRDCFLRTVIHVLNGTLFKTEIVSLFSLGFFIILILFVPVLILNFAIASIFAVSDSNKSIHTYLYLCSEFLNMTHAMNDEGLLLLP